MGLVDQDDDVIALIEDTLGLTKFVDRSDDDLADVLAKQVLHILAALGLDQIRRVGGVEGA